jgi:shikimate dehydrogenase
MLFINKNTKIYGSFSQNAGNKGCEFFNKAFKKYNIDAIYKSFSVNNIEKALDSAKTLKFSGFAVSMPFKIAIYDLIDEVSECALNSKSVNTVILNQNGNTMGYNTDYHAAKCLLFPYVNDYKKLYILGKGGLSRSVYAQAKNLGFNIITITRDNWNDIYSLKNCLIFNCTPVEQIQIDDSNIYINCLIGTVTGDEFNKHQAIKQFELYSNIKYEL